MSIRTKFTVDISLSESTGEAKELGTTPPWRGTSDQLDDGGTFRRRLAGGASDVVVALNGLTTVKFIAIKTTQSITVKKNSSGGEAWTIKPLGTGATDGVFLICTDSVTALYLSNPGTSEAEVTISLAGTV